eukprot:994454_1
MNFNFSANKSLTPTKPNVIHNAIKFPQKSVTPVTQVASTNKQQPTNSYLTQLQPSVPLTSAAFYGRNPVSYFPQQRFAFCMPRIVSSSVVSNIQNPPVITQSFTSMTQQYQQMMAAAQVSQRQPTTTTTAKPTPSV